MLQQDEEAVLAFFLTHIAEIAEGHVGTCCRVYAVDLLVVRGPTQAHDDGDICRRQRIIVLQGNDSAVGIALVLAIGIGCGQWGDGGIFCTAAGHEAVDVVLLVFLNDNV